MKFVFNRCRICRSSWVNIPNAPQALFACRIYRLYDAPDRCEDSCWSEGGVHVELKGALLVFEEEPV